MLEIDVRHISEYKEITVTMDNTTIVSGFLDKQESHDIAIDLISAAEDLLEQEINIDKNEEI